MKFESSVIIACPNCNQPYSYTELSSWNTFNSDFYSDGYISLPLFEYGITLTKCEKCEKFNWVKNFKKIEEHKLNANYNEDLKNAKKLKRINIQELNEIISSDFLETDEDKLYIRILLWQAFNDRIRNECKYYPLSCNSIDEYKKTSSFKFNIEQKLFKDNSEKIIWKNNLNEILILLQEHTLLDKLIVAEIYRNLGKFNECLKVLKQLNSIDFEWIAKSIRHECAIKNKYLILLDNEKYKYDENNIVPETDFYLLYESTNITTVKIGNQEWMAENLNVARFNNGDLIPHAKTKLQWEKAAVTKQPAWCYFKNDLNFGKSFGRLYNYYAVIDERGLIPPGWHIPSHNEWKKLIKELGGESIAGGKLKSAAEWSAPNKGATNLSQLNFMPSGERSFYGMFSAVGEKATLWTSTDIYSGENWSWQLHCKLNGIIRTSNNWGVGLAIRCIKN